MEKQITDLFNETILQEAMRRYDIAKEDLRLLDAFESFVYEFTRQSPTVPGSQDFILRIGHSLRRSEALIQGEMDWINYLAAGGVSVARAVKSEKGNLVEAIEDGKGGHFLTTAFVKAPGKSPWKLWTPALYETYGKLLGSIHSLTKGYQPVRPEWKRPDWDDPLMEFVESYLPPSEALAKAKYQHLCEHVRSLPRDANSYGLVHQDAHGSNFLVDEDGTITLFDFDDCVYSWFVNDIAIALFYIVTGRNEQSAFTAKFMRNFLIGYRQANHLDPEWLKEVPVFLKMREIELYGVIHRDFDVEDIDNDWCERFMRDRKYKIEHDIPYIDFDFESLGVYL
jgi:amicoumacin kinase